MSREPMKARLAAATPGPWHVDRDEPGDVASVVAYAHNDGVTIGTYVADTVEEDGDAELIAHAPTDLAKLHAALDAVEALADDAETQPTSELMTVRGMAVLIRAAIRYGLGDES